MALLSLKSEKRALWLLAPVMVLLAGCTGAASDEGPPAGVVRVWGFRGRIDGGFVKPRVVDVLLDGRIVVMDRSPRVQLFDGAGSYLTHFMLEHTETGYPTGMSVDSEGHMWIAETHANRVAVYTPEFEEIMSFGSYGDGEGEFVYVTDVALSPGGKVWVSEYGGDDRVQEFDREGRFVRVIGRAGVEPGEFRRPQALLALPDESLLVADTVNHRIEKFSADGELAGVFGTAGGGAGELRYPYDMAAGRDGVVYVVEYGNNRIQRMTPEGEFAGTWAGRGRWRLATPWSVAASGGRLYVLDTGNSRVVELDPAAMEWSSGGES